MRPDPLELETSGVSAPCRFYSCVTMLRLLGGEQEPC